MPKEQTLALIKPDAIAKQLEGKIIDDILTAGFTIKAMRLLYLKEAEARDFYAVHRNKEFYEPLVAFMTSGPIIVMTLERENAVEAYRALMGKTDPAEAAEGTLRKKYGENTRRNAVHGSDSQENAKKEIAFFF